MDRYGAVFVHIPKAAGTSVITALAGRRLPRDHASWMQFAQADRRRFAKYFKFAFVRNPWDRVFSVFNYLSKGGNQGSDTSLSEQVRDCSFEEFLMDYLDECRIHEHVLFKPQYLFVCDHDLEVKVDFIGRYENIEREFTKVRKALGARVALPRKNVSPGRGDYRHCYTDPAMVRRVRELYRNDCDLFGYDY